MEMETVEEWDELYEKADPIPPAQVLSENLHLLPDNGVALDLACGLAENGFLLAKAGLEVCAWDNSPVAIKRVNEKAISTGLSVKAENRDIFETKFPKEHYDVIVLTHYLEHTISESIFAALKPGGLLFFQSFIQDSVENVGPPNNKFRLKRNELLTMFPGLRILVYREEGRLGDVTRGFRNEAMLVGIKDI